MIQIRNLRLATGCLVAAGIALLSAGCSMLSSGDDTASAKAAAPVSARAQMQDKLPAGTQIITQKISYLLTPSDSIFVLAADDFAADGARYQNSGRFLQHVLSEKLSQYGSKTVLQQGYFRQDLATDEAAVYGCNVLMKASIEKIYDRAEDPKEVTIRVDTYSARNKELLNSALLRMQAPSLSRVFAADGTGLADELMACYVHLLYSRIY